MQVDYLIQEERFSVPKISVDGGTMGVDVIKVIKTPHSTFITITPEQSAQTDTYTLSQSFLLFSLSSRHQDPSVTLANSPNGLP
jgi:hypothetical protein